MASSEREAKVIEDYPVEYLRDKPGLAQAIEEVEAGRVMQITRAGKPVAVLIDIEEYEAMKRALV